MLLRKEIGGEFDISTESLAEALCSKESIRSKKFFGNVVDFVYLSNGRAAIKFILAHILRKKQINRYWLPSYLCRSIVQPFKELNLSYEFYNVKEGLQVDIGYLSSRVKKGDLILVLDYFGFSPAKEVINFLQEMKDYGIPILWDLTHSFLTKNNWHNEIASYSVVSFRKWFGIPDGGIAISNTDLFDKNLILGEPFYGFAYLRLLAAILKNFYLRSIIQEKNFFRTEFAKAEELADSFINLNAMSDLSKKFLNSIDFTTIINRRRKNFIFLLSGISKVKGISSLYSSIEESICPLGFPIITVRRDALKEFLINNDIFCPIHWAPLNEVPMRFTYAHYLSHNMLTIPCDQRYSPENMERIFEKISEFYKGSY
jgi:dTDP-4-amino-4,6-dideoxygalactose transaminase